MRASSVSSRPPAARPPRPARPRGCARCWPAALRHGREELAKPRSGYDAPVEVGFAAQDGLLLAATPAGAALRADPKVAGEREWLLVAAAVATLVDLACPGIPADGRRPRARGGGDRRLPRARLPGRDRPRRARRVRARDLRRARRPHRPPARRRARAPARACSTPPTLRAPIGTGHPLRVAEAEARLPAELDGEQREDAVLALLEPAGGAACARTRTPIPPRRVARRILQRLDGMGKWGGYHTDFAHLARGFAGNERALAQEVGEALLDVRAARREAVRGPAARVPQPPPRGRHAGADRPRRGPTGAATARPLILIRGMSLPGQVATQVKTKLQTLATLTSAGHRPPDAPRPAAQHRRRARPLGADAGGRLHRPPPPATRTTSRSSTSWGRSPSSRSTSAPTRSRTRCARTASGRATAWRSCAATTAGSSRPWWRARSSAPTPCSSTRRSPSRS